MRTNFQTDVAISLGAKVLLSSTFKPINLWKFADWPWTAAISFFYASFLNCFCAQKAFSNVNNWTEQW